MYQVLKILNNNTILAKEDDNEIIVMDNVKIIEFSRFNELINKREEFYNLYYIEGENMLYYNKY